MGQKFQRRPENFNCAKCGDLVIGTGYTNHCPRCLWSQHVDVNPGDRADACGGLMEPVGVELIHDQFIITHRCQRCGVIKRNRAAENDDRSAILKIASDIARRESTGRDV